MITGIEILKFGVEDRAASNKFLADFGLSQSTSDIEGADLYQTQNAARFIYLIVMITVCRLLLSKVQLYVK